MTSPNTDRIAKIQKILALANDPGVTEGEREAAQQKAAALMIAWGIEDAMLHQHDRVGTEPIVTVIVTPGCPKIYSREFSAIGVYVARSFNCMGIFDQYATETRGFWSVDLVGFQSDVERLQVLVQSLATQAMTALAQAIKAERRWEWMSASEKYNFRRSFVVGFADTVSDRIDAVYRKTVEQSSTPGTDLVLVDRRKKVADWVDENMRLSMSGRGHRYTAHGADEGSAAGARADIGQSRFGGIATGAIGR